MTLYTFQDLTLDVQSDWPETSEELELLLQALSWRCTNAPDRRPLLYLSVRYADHARGIPIGARVVFQAEGISGCEDGADFYLSDGASLFSLRCAQGRGEACLVSSFLAHSAVLRSTFWTFGLLKLLRPLGCYSLHAAGVVSPAGRSLLIVGASGRGKSTLALGLIGHGWHYLSDDAVLLRLQPAGVAAFALRQHWYIDASVAPAYAALPLGEAVLDTAGGQRRRVYLEEVCPAQHMTACLPQVLVFARLVPQERSVVRPLDPLKALTSLLECSGPQLFDRRTMPQHLAVLNRLLRQTTSYELQAGRDLLHHPLILVHLLAEVEGADRWPG